MDSERAGNLQPSARATLNRSAGLAIVAGLALAPVDYTIVAASFLYRPLGGEIVLAVVAAVFLFGVVLRRAELIYASQFIVLAPLIVRMVEHPRDVDLGSILTVGLAAGGVAALAWAVARVFSRRSPPDVN